MKVNWDDYSQNQSIFGNIEVMFQTTNQHISISNLTYQVFFAAFHLATTTAGSKSLCAAEINPDLGLPMHHNVGPQNAIAKLV